MWLQQNEGKKNTLSHLSYSLNPFEDRLDGVITRSQTYRQNYLLVTNSILN